MVPKPTNQILAFLCTPPSLFDANKGNFSMSMSCACDIFVCGERDGMGNGWLVGDKADGGA